MVMARAIERRVWLLHRTGLATASLANHGSEAVQVAAAASLRPGIDWVVPQRGDLALCLAMGITPLDVMLGVLGRAGDPASAGRLEPGSFGSREARIVATSSTAGAHVLHAAGIAYGSKHLARDEVTLVSADGRAAGSGDWHEGINFAAVHRLPLICLVVDSTGDTAVPLTQPESDPLVRRASAYGAAGDAIPGADFDRGLESFAKAVVRARSGLGPTVIHATVSSTSGLTVDGKVRPREELELQARRDPIELMGRALASARLLDEATELRIHRDCLAVAATAAGQARASAPPEAAAALDNVIGRNDG